MEGGHALFRQLIELAPDAVWINDGRQLVFANPATARMLGYSDVAEVLALDPGVIVHPDDRQAMRQRSGQMIATGSSLPPFEYRVQHRDGRWLVTEVHSMPIQWEGRPAILGFARDITARKEMESRLVRADRLAALGTLLAGIAHEMNNPLSYVLLGTEEAADTLANLPPGQVPTRLQQVIGDVRHGVDRLTSIVRQLRTTARPESTERGPVDLHQVLESALRTIQNEIRHRARLSVSCDPVPGVLGSAQRLEQVFLNLLVNATQALPERRPENEIRVRLCCQSPDQVMVEVSDNGPGIAPEVLPRVFDPFFTTKAIGLGMGLGLSICHGIVAAHGGSITVHSDGVGSGATFRVVLPASLQVAPVLDLVADSVEAAQRQPARSRRRVLVIDDEAALGAMVQRMLNTDFQVDAVVDARRALARLAGDGYDVILCDLMMPEMTGMDLYEEATRRQPELGPRFVFMTGGAFTARAAEFLARVPNRRIDKPFNRAALHTLLTADPAGPTTRAEG